MTAQIAEEGVRRHRLLLQTLEPLHVGTGAYRLGRVDLPIVREPGTRLPKIPGTSLHGAARTYADYAWAASRQARPRCSGSGQKTPDEADSGHCKQPGCPVCSTFGYLNDEAGGNSGVVSIGDARVLFFPVYSAEGPVWITSEQTLSDFGVRAPALADPMQIRVGSALAQRGWLNLGWLLLKCEGSFTVQDLPSQLPETVTSRSVLLSDALFGRVVESNLEVRTSVSIDPLTGAAADQALFTYEAIPRASWFWMEVIEDRSRAAGFVPANGWTSPFDVVETGLSWMQLLGVGGMGTRGFGRLRHFKMG
jgi:CRISPR-associated protein Cmr4